MKFLKSHWSNIVFLIIILLIIIPQTRKPIQIGLNRIFSFSPSEIKESKRMTLYDYNWQLKDMEGETLNFKEAKGEVAIVNLWATWCPPCIAEMPAFQSLYDDYGDKVKFYFVSSEESVQLQKFLEKKKYNFPVFQPNTAAPQLLNSNSLPTTYVLSKNGEIVIQKSGAADWNSSEFRGLLDELLGETP